MVASALGLFFSLVASAQTLNPKMNLLPVNPGLEGKAGVVRVYKSQSAEVHIKSTPLPDEAAAARFSDVSFGLIKGLYEPKKNPYAGEVTNLVRCDTKFAPSPFELKCGGKTVSAIAGGVGERHAFGMCRKADIVEVGVFFSCFDSVKKEIQEVRLFLPFKKESRWLESLKAAQKMASELIL